MSTTAAAASATYRCDLGEGLVARWSTVDDTENIAQLCGKVFRDAEDEPFNPRTMDKVYRMMRGDFPLMGSGDAQCPELVFLQLLSGYRSLDELRSAFPDVQAQGEAEVLLKALFPRSISWVLPLA